MIVCLGEEEKRIGRLLAVELEIQFHCETFPKILQAKISKYLQRI
jgi:hypothetical protein